MKKLTIAILVVIALSVSYGYNGFCFAPKISGSTVDNWSLKKLNLTLEISSNFKENISYCMTNVSNVKINSNGDFSISNILVASPNKYCLLKIKTSKLGYLPYESYLKINPNETNYSLNIKLEPNTKIIFREFGTNKTLEGSSYVNGKLYKIKKGIIRFPLNQSILYIFYMGDEDHDKLSEVLSIDHLWKENVVNVTVYKKPKISIKLLQDKNITNVGQEVKITFEIENKEKYSSPFRVNYKIVGCGINDSSEINKNKIITYFIKPKTNCTINLKYVIFDEISKEGTSGSISITHKVTNKIKIEYWTKNDYVYARAYDVNGNPIKTNLTLIYGNKKIKMKEKGYVYYSKIPGNKFELSANNTRIPISGEFIKKPKLNLNVITLEIILIGLAIFWIYKAKVLKLRR